MALAHDEAFSLQGEAFREGLRRELKNLFTPNGSYGIEVWEG